jgi:predicted nuclease with TOPRIM domain
MDSITRIQQLCDTQLSLTQSQNDNLKAHNQKLTTKLLSLNSTNRELEDKIYSIEMELSEKTTELEETTKKLLGYTKIKKELADLKAYIEEPQFAKKRIESWHSFGVGGQGGSSLRQTRNDSGWVSPTKGLGENALV